MYFTNYLLNYWLPEKSTDYSGERQPAQVINGLYRVRVLLLYYKVHGKLTELEMSVGN